MRNRKRLREKFADPGSKLSEVNEILRQSLIFEVLIDIRELLQSSVTSTNSLAIQEEKNNKVV